MKRGKTIAKYVSFCLGLGIILLIASTQISITYAQAAPVQYDVKKLCTYLNNPQVQAFLDTIAFSEGTLNKLGYRTMHTYKYFQNFKDHPRKLICKEYNGKMHCSTSAGRYQFLEKTWDKISPRIRAKNFSPANQDLAALALITERNALNTILSMRSRRDFCNDIYKINKTWAALPGAPYGQTTTTIPQLEAVYKKRLQYHTQNTPQQDRCKLRNHTVSQLDTQ
jgi:muramidase (phage lysozyme)